VQCFCFLAVGLLRSTGTLFSINWNHDFWK
jgi:hypothetical protein